MSHPAPARLPAPHATLAVFVATRLEDVPDGCRRYISVDGSVPGAEVTWDHHVTGEPINLDAMPEVFDASGFDAVATTSPDADALVSVVAVLHGGKGRLPGEVRAVFESAAYWCDHLRGHPALDADTNRRGRGLLDHVATSITGTRAERAQRFIELARELSARVERGEPLPFLDVWPEQVALARRLKSEGRLRPHGHVMVIELRDAPPIDPAALYAEHALPVSVHVERHDDGGPRYTVGLRPGPDVPLRDLVSALHALARAEHAHGPPALSPEPVPGAENWGGRATVFGSPWNYGSRLEPDEVAGIVERALFGGSMDVWPAIGDDR